MIECSEIRGRLTLYLDHELQGEEYATVEAHLKECESCASEFERERTFLEVVRAGNPLHVATPELRTKVSGILETVPVNRTIKSKRSRLWLPIAAAILVVVMPLLIWRVVLWDDSGAVNGPSNFALMAADTHLRRTRGQLPLEVATADPQQISQWFTNKVNFSVQLPNYQESSGQDKLYTLEGARLVGFKDDYAAYVAYRMKARPISLVITSAAVARPAGGEEIQARGLRFHYDAIQGLKVITWSDRGLTYALVSDLDERGQESCIVCHQGTKDQDLIAPLRLK